MKICRMGRGMSIGLGFAVLLLRPSVALGNEDGRGEALFEKNLRRSVALMARVDGLATTPWGEETASVVVEEEFQVGIVPVATQPNNPATAQACNPTVAACNETVAACNPTEAACNQTTATCNDTVANCNWTDEQCQETVAACNPTVDECNQTVAGCNATVKACNPTLTACNQTEPACNATSQACNPTEGACFPTAVECNQTVGACLPTIAECNATTKRCNPTESACNPTECGGDPDQCESDGDAELYPGVAVSLAYGGPSIAGPGTSSNGSAPFSFPWKELGYVVAAVVIAVRRLRVA